MERMMTTTTDRTTGAEVPAADPDRLFLMPPPAQLSSGAQINAWLAGVPVGSTVVVGAGTYLTDQDVRVPDGVYLRGTAPHGYGSDTVFKQADGAAIAGAVLCTAGWYNNATSSGRPSGFADITVDGNEANCPSSTASGVVMMNYWSTVSRLYVKNCPTDGIRLADQNRAGVSISNSASENRVLECKVANVGRHAYYVQCTNNISNQDGWLQDCLGSETGGDFIRFDRISGWCVRRNHGYSIGANGIVGANAFASMVVENEIEQIGANNEASAFYSGISITQLNGRSTIVANNFVGLGDLAGTATFQGIVISAGVDQVASVTCVGNEILGLGTAGSRGLVGQTLNAGATLNLNEMANTITSCNTATFFDTRTNVNSYSSGHLISRGAKPTFTNGAQGTGAVSSVGTDTAGRFTTTSVASPAAGNIMVITYARAYTVQPTVVISPRNAVSADCRPYITSEGVGGFTIACAAAPAASQTLSFAYHVIQTP